ncbi:DUF5134 domain-containing protein [Streptomyces sp. HC44]|uniref:DUF5134 domain-containing protein n=2 Tax=Streptomyces scabichelini TaxID=2711217 RepID=A0A6G4UXF1_9ACTN|nr:DUF5134 domain-containing protein [Streptomyces scabichelini]
MATTTGGARFAAGGDLLMSVCMAVMALPATVSWYAEYGMWWAAAFALLGLGGVAVAVKHTREAGWRHGRHWVHLIVGSAGMVIMTLAMTSTSSGPVLALGGSHMAHMPGMQHMEMEGAEAASHSHMESMGGMESMHGGGHGQGHGMNMSDMTAAASGGTSTSSDSAWRLVVMALAVYFLLSIAASVWARIRGADRGHRLTEGREGGRRRSWGRWLLAMPDTVVVFLASLTIAVWDRARTAKHGGHGRRRRSGAAPEAALAAHIGMGGTMSAMLLMMVA